MATCRCKTCGQLHEGEPNGGYEFCSLHGGTGVPMGLGNPGAGMMANATARRLGPVQIKILDSIFTPIDSESFGYVALHEGKWWVRLPGMGHFSNCSNHQVQESNGNITFSPSLRIQFYSNEEEGLIELHGFIKNSVWSDA